MIPFIFTVLVSFSFGHIDAFYYNDTTFIETIKTNLHFKQYYNPLYNQTIDFLKFLSNHHEIKLPCRSSLRRWIKGIETNEMWALKCYTVNGKLTGGNVNFGSFDNCVDFTRNEVEKIDFDGKYCLVSIQTLESEKIRRLKNFQIYISKMSKRSAALTEFNIGNAHGLCVPSTCDINEIVKVFNSSFKSYGFTLLPPKRCTTANEPEPITKLQIFSFIILSIGIVLCWLSSFIRSDFLSNFSISQNLNKIYSVDYRNENGESKIFLHAIKFILIISSIACHTFVFLGVYFAQPYGNAKDFAPNLVLRKVLGRMLAFSDILFFLGGFFAMYAWYDVIKNGRIAYNFVYFFIGRYVKVAIISAIVILITFLLPHLGTGPYYSTIINHLYENCKENGWKEFALISNEQRIIDMCIIPGWYLSADFQIYLLNYFVIYYLIMRPKLGFILFFGQIFIATALWLAYIHYSNISIIQNFFSLVIYDLSNLEDSHLHFFYHYFAYSAGLICAWCVKNEIKSRFMGSWLVQMAIFVYHVITIYWMMEYLHSIEYKGAVQGKYMKFFWPLIEKFVVNGVYFWLMYSALSGYLGSLENKFDFKFTIPWSRMSFTLVISQFTFLFYALGQMREVFHFDLMSLINQAMFSIVCVFVLGNFVFVFFECPLINLMATYSGYKKRSQLNTTNRMAKKMKCKIEKEQ